MKNPWIKSKITINPYHETAFKAVGIAPDVVSPVDIRRKTEDRRKAVNRVPGTFKLGNRNLEQTDITRAAEILSAPNRRTLEELLEHTSESPQVQEIERLKKHFPKPDWPETLPKLVKMDFIKPIVYDIALFHLKNLNKSFAELLQKRLPEGPPEA